MDNDTHFEDFNDSSSLRNEIIRYVAFWPYFLIILITFILSAFLYLRYTTNTYKTSTLIEIMDDAQNREMALPTEMTIFNRSMINLENEINRLNSYQLNSTVVKAINANVLYFSKGRIRTSQVTAENWYKQYELDFKIDTDLIEKQVVYTINADEGKLVISHIDASGNFINSVNFNSLSTLEKNHNLPFDLSIYSIDDISSERELILMPVENKANFFRSSIKISPQGKESDQLSLTMTHRNYEIAQNYLNELVKYFDMDGIKDGQLEYKRTIDFVNQREKILKEDLNIVEFKKQKYKQDNNLSDISLDANNNIDLKYTYNSEIFQLESQKEIAEYLEEFISDSEYGYLPINIGLENFDLNVMINSYNEIVSNRFRYLNETGSNNFLVKSLEPELDNLIENINVSLNNFTKSIDLKLNNLKLKEAEFDDEYNRVPENEKTLRSIERELSIKEALYLLLLQKREEASINLAVVKPTIKVIDYAITDFSSKTPNAKIIYFGSVVSALILYIFFLYVWFLMDNKIHNRDQLIKLLDTDIPIIGEIPFLKDINVLQDKNNSRSVIQESIRMLLSNLKFTLADSVNNKNSQTIIFTSSIKGEGKTLASVHAALGLANDLRKDKKVIILGTDLRNPQVHKAFGVDKSQIGISEIIYNSDYKNYKNYISRYENLDVLFSGAIPPNPTALLSGDIFKNLIELLKNEYDYIIIDSAPCLLVSDTFQFIDYADSVVFLFRANFTDSKILDFINETYRSKKIKNFNIVLNAVGDSAGYGYKYGYQYGYQYGYKYAYNYGYGYGYGVDDK